MSPPATDDPFATLGLPHSFRLDPASLRAAYIRLMETAHPDRATSQLDAADRARRAAAINDAQRRLAHPLRRAEAMLQVAGAAGLASAALPPDFLVEAMELREELDEALANRDVDRIASLRAAAVARRDAEIDRLADHLDRVFAENGDARAAAVAAAQDALNRLRYVMRLIDRVADADGDLPGAEG